MHSIWEITKEREQSYYYFIWQIFYLQNCKVITFEENYKIIWKMIYLISQVTFIFLTQIYYNMNFITLSSNFITRFPWYFKINLHWLLLEDNFLAHKKCIFLNMPAKLVLRIRNFVKMQGNLWKISCSLPTLLKILVFHNFFPNFSDNCILRTSIF